MLKKLFQVFAFVGWLIQRLLTRKDAHEPQQRIDDARTQAATGDDAGLNASLDAARDRLRDKGTGG
jgi:hypothetical protein